MSLRIWYVLLPPPNLSCLDRGAVENPKAHAKADRKAPSTTPSPCRPDPRVQRRRDQVWHPKGLKSRHIYRPSTGSASLPSIHQILRFRTYHPILIPPSYRCPRLPPQRTRELPLEPCVIVEDLTPVAEEAPTWPSSPRPHDLGRLLNRT